MPSVPHPFFFTLSWTPLPPSTCRASLPHRGSTRPGSAAPSRPSTPLWVERDLHAPPPVNKKCLQLIFYEHMKRWKWSNQTVLRCAASLSPQSCFNTHLLKGDVSLCSPGARGAFHMDRYTNYVVPNIFPVAILNTFDNIFATSLWSVDFYSIFDIWLENYVYLFCSKSIICTIWQRLSSDSRLRYGKTPKWSVFC